ncbi:helix-turn-helix transcriptional regulator [Salipaludibacillus sp. HK11]|uniref:helix-turn-helix transcriptional regulator n=1 Tax=Salipaludibacillus sp. HK11 TaxID=3394320 RepID=UPI0039FCED0E
MTIDKVKRATQHTSSNYDSYSFRQEVLNELRAIFPFEASCFTTVDPNTLLSTGAVTDPCIEKIHSYLFENEYMSHDFNHYTSLTKLVKPIATLGLSTNGNPYLSKRYRDILLPAGFGDELRAALMYQGKCWGFLTLFRSTEQLSFSASEVESIMKLLPSIAQSLRDKTLYSSLPPHLETFKSAVMIISENFDLISTNDAADSLLLWLREKENIAPTILPRPIRAICSRTKANSYHSQNEDEAKVCTRSFNGPFVSIQASELNSFSPSKQYAVITERAQPHEVMALAIEYYGLTLREKQIVERVVHGDSSKQIANSLNISLHTVQDHLKSIFYKTSVSSRRELIWLMLSQYSLPSSNVLTKKENVL